MGLFQGVPQKITTTAAGEAQTQQITSYENYDDGWYKAGYAPSPRFTDNLDGTITDNATGLMWAQNPMLLGGGTYPNAWALDASTPQFVDWATAISMCESLSYAGYTDWRLPNIKEMISICNLELNSPCVDTSIFTGIVNSNYWSSTTHDINDVAAEALNYENGDFQTLIATRHKVFNTIAIIPVRAGTTHH